MRTSPGGFSFKAKSPTQSSINRAGVRVQDTKRGAAHNHHFVPGNKICDERWYRATALNDLLGIEAGKINDTRLYHCQGRLLSHKAQLERQLRRRYATGGADLTDANACRNYSQHRNKLR